MSTRPTPEPEILRPRFNRGADLFSDGNLDMLSHLLDDFLRIPGTNIRFGLDGVIGLVPGIGDVLGALASWIIILAAWLRGVPRLTLARMLANVAIETVIGTIPVLGDAFDIVWKANRRNFALLERATNAAAYAGTNVPQNLRLPPTVQQRHRHAVSDWLFLLSLVLGMFLLLAIPLALLAFVAGKFLALGMRH